MTEIELRLVSRLTGLFISELKRAWENVLSLNVVQRYVKRLVENSAAKKFLNKRYPEILEELNDLVAMEAL